MFDTSLIYFFFAFLSVAQAGHVVEHQSFQMLSLCPTSWSSWSLRAIAWCTSRPLGCRALFTSSDNLGGPLALIYTVESKLITEHRIKPHHKLMSDQNSFHRRIQVSLSRSSLIAPFKLLMDVNHTSLVIYSLWPPKFSCSEFENVLDSGKSLDENPKCTLNSPSGRIQFCLFTSQ